MQDIEFTTSSGEKIPIVITVRRGLRNITLRPRAGKERCINVSRPWLASNAAVMKFIEQKYKWLDRFFANAPRKEKLKSGDCFHFLDHEVRVLYDADTRGTRFVMDDNVFCTLFVGGDKDLLENRVRTFIKSELLKQIRELIRRTPREFWPRRICLRDTTSRWGSCSTTGTMSFSWRLVFAPYEVMRYVVMHELSHMKHMDHSPQFWAQVRELYGFGLERAKMWLNKNGATLHTYL